MTGKRRIVGQILLIIAVVMGIFVIGETRVHDAAAAHEGKAGNNWRFDGGLTWHPLEG